MGETPGESRKRIGCLRAVTVLHATDLRQVPLILAHGLYSGIGRAPLAIGDDRGRAYTRQLVARQQRKGWQIVVLVFVVPRRALRVAAEPAGVGMDVLPAPSRPRLPPGLLEELAMILPQGPRIVRAFVEWHREGRLVRLPPASLDRSATLGENGALVMAGHLSASTLGDLEAILGRRGGTASRT